MTTYLYDFSIVRLDTSCDSDNCVTIGLFEIAKVIFCCLSFLDPTGARMEGGAAAMVVNEQTPPLLFNFTVALDYFI